MSTRNNIIKDRNKKLFESRLQIKTNSSSKINKISHHNKRNNNNNNNSSFLNNTQPFTKVIFHKKRNNQSILDSSSLNNNDNNNSINKKFMLFLSFALHYTTNALFFDESNLHQIYEDKGKFNITFQLPKIIFSALISTLVCR